MAKMTFEVQWCGEEEAGIMSGRETVTIEFARADLFSEDEMDYWRQSLREYFDGAVVMTTEEYRKVIEEEDLIQNMFDRSYDL